MPLPLAQAARVLRASVQPLARMLRARARAALAPVIHARVQALAADVPGVRAQQMLHGDFASGGTTGDHVLRRCVARANARARGRAAANARAALAPVLHDRVQAAARVLHARARGCALCHDRQGLWELRASARGRRGFCSPLQLCKIWCRILHGGTEKQARDRCVLTPSHRDCLDTAVTPGLIEPTWATERPLWSRPSEVFVDGGKTTGCRLSTRGSGNGPSGDLQPTVHLSSVAVVRWRTG